MNFKKTVKDKKIWVREEELQNIPAILKKEYQLLQQSVQNDDICGALFRLKDIYEICIKLPSILSIITISARMERDRAFVRMPETQLKKEQEDFLTGREVPESDSEQQEKFRYILSHMVKEPLSIGNWRQITSSIVENAGIFALDKDLKEILERTLLLFQVKPRKVREQGRYEDVGNWRNKTIGHGTLFINTEAYWEQVYDLVQGLFLYFGGNGNTPLKEFYGRISIEKESDGSSVLKVREQTYPISEYIYSFEEKDYFFDSYYSRQKYAEITNYLDAPRRLKNNPYYENIYSMLDGRKKSQRRKKERQITKSSDREAYACLNCAPGYEKPEFVLDEIRTFMEEHDRGILHIQMERGMGKSILAHELDGRYQRGILQEDLKAVVRVYHIRDMQFREENPARDFFTALSSNLSSFDGGQLEMDNEDYYIDGKDIRQQMEHGGDDAPAAFCQYLELFRERYEEELTDHEGTEEKLKLVYILDGIDELGSNAGSVLDAIPDPVFLNALLEENHIYLILLSRIQDEEDLQGTAKEWIREAEKKAGRIVQFDGGNECYLALLKKYLQKNYKKLSDEQANDIIEKAQRKFLYIRPYLARGDSVLKADTKITAYDVAANYMEKLQKRYCGTSLHTLQLISAAIAVFGSATLREICELVLFTGISYDVVGVLNDILPLLTVKRAAGENRYEFANEAYGQYIFESLSEAAEEAVCRYRISLVSWFQTADWRKDDYGKQWGEYVRRALNVDGAAKKMGFGETTEEYVKSLIHTQYDRAMQTYYASQISEELQCDVLRQIRLLHYGKMQILSAEDFRKVPIQFQKREPWYLESGRLAYEYTQGLISHCMEHESVDEWFQVFTAERMNLRDGLNTYADEPRMSAFREIMEAWKDQESAVTFFLNLIKQDRKEQRGFFYGNSYGVYLEQLLPVVRDGALRNKIYDGLLDTYDMLADAVSQQPEIGKIDQNRKETMLRILEMAEQQKELENDERISRIKKAIFWEDIVNRTIVQLEELAENITSFRPREYSDKIFFLQLREETLTKEQLKRYQMAVVRNAANLLGYLKKIFKRQNVDAVYPWLREPYFRRNFDFFPQKLEGLIVEYLELFEQVIKIYGKENKVERIGRLEDTFLSFLRYYDQKVREKSIGLYSGYIEKEKVNRQQKMTSWEKTYALYCSSGIFIAKKDAGEGIPIVVNRFTEKYLQELYEEDLEAYEELNRKIEESYASIHFRENYILVDQACHLMLIPDYYNWICVRYNRSLEKKDGRKSEELFRWLECEYACLLEKVTGMLKSETDLIHKSEVIIGIKRFSRELLRLAEMVPDEIATAEETRRTLLVELEELAEKAEEPGTIKKVTEEIEWSWRQ